MYKNFLATFLQWAIFVMYGYMFNDFFKNDGEVFTYQQTDACTGLPHCSPSALSQIVFQHQARLFLNWSPVADLVCTWPLLFGNSPVLWLRVLSLPLKVSACLWLSWVLLLRVSSSFFCLESATAILPMPVLVSLWREKQTPTARLLTVSLIWVSWSVSWTLLSPLS